MYFNHRSFGFGIGIRTISDFKITSELCMVTFKSGIPVKVGLSSTIWYRMSKSRRCNWYSVWNLDFVFV